ncbi:type II toxin-antitoxin system VapC family toxin [Glycomyces paridis]|uniref:Ribonuclease VapC n=1 Tax=Glycomyces paridis TaxID=2126555 RepID=A0A4S8PP06_9ACTN|nr:type II toxin-antitoxin system VapC family toxin [Glycomyces paridis]THV31402.1 type II toxin-antitoxin system VapC family toxin [Glycomyces paridis]
MVVVVDTNVVSELIRAEPEPAVLDWFDGLPGVEPHLTATTVLELYFGAGRLPEGSRKTQLMNRIDIMVHEIFRGRVLAYDAVAAEIGGGLMADLERRGRAIGLADVEIAAVCSAAGAPLATRNTKHFEGLGLVLINPWSE